MSNNHSDKPQHEVSEAKRQYVKNHHAIRLMREQDVDQCLHIFRDHGLATSAHGLRTFREMDPEGCHVLTPLDDDSEVISFTAASKYDPRVAVVSFYGTKSGYQGLGLGVKIWKDGLMTFLKDCDNIGLSAAPDEVKMYKEKVGLTVEGETKMLVFDKTGQTNPDNITPTQDEASQVKVVDLLEGDATHVFKYDREIVGFDREKLIVKSVFEPGTVCLVAVSPQDRVIGESRLHQKSRKLIYLFENRMGMHQTNQHDRDRQGFPRTSLCRQCYRGKDSDAQPHESIS